jgi:hypothetical protein
MDRIDRIKALPFCLLFHITRLVGLVAPKQIHLTLFQPGTTPGGVVGVDVVAAVGDGQSKLGRAGDVYVD